MELRVLKYFLTIAREESINRAAEVLHVSQPTVSRQIHELEEQLGKELFLRGNRRIVLTNDGRLLRKRAEEILSLVDKTEQEIMHQDEELTGDIYIASGESEAFSVFSRAAARLHREHPLVRFHISSGDMEDIADRLEKGLIDFAGVYYQPDPSLYEAIGTNFYDRFGVVMREDDPLAQKSGITPEDLWPRPLLISRQFMRYWKGTSLFDWLQKSPQDLNVTATISLLYNASLLVREGLGLVFTFEHLLTKAPGSGLCFRPLEPQLTEHMQIVWKKYQVFSRTSEVYLRYLREAAEENLTDASCRSPQVS